MADRHIDVDQSYPAIIVVKTVGKTPVKIRDGRGFVSASVLATSNRKMTMKVHAKTAMALVYGTAAAMVMAGAAALIASQPANAKPEFAASTGKPCGTCHTNPTGGGKLKAAGEKFKADGYKMK